MSEMRSGGRTVVLVSHALSQVQQMCDHAVWLDHGQVRASGRTEHVVARYLESVTTAYRLDCRGRQRMGSGEIELEVEVIPHHDDGIVRTDSGLTIRFHWATEQRMEDLGFGFTIRSADGYVVFGAGTGHETQMARLGPGGGDDRLRDPAPAPVAGRRTTWPQRSQKRHTRHVYDHSPNIVEFDVASSPGHESQQGAVDLDGRWTEGPS